MSVLLLGMSVVNRGMASLVISFVSDTYQDGYFSVYWLNEEQTLD